MSIFAAEPKRWMRVTAPVSAAQRLQENATSFSSAHPAQRRCSKPLARWPHSRKASNSSVTSSGKPDPVCASTWAAEPGFWYHQALYCSGKPMICYTRSFEDVMLQRVLRDVEQGCYLDIGACAPIMDSNTFAFYE